MEEVERRNAELEREVTGLRNSYWTERKARLAAEAQVEAMRKALEPFAEGARSFDGFADDELVNCDLTIETELGSTGGMFDTPVSSFRTAQAALSAPAEEGKEDGSSRDHAPTLRAALEGIVQALQLRRGRLTAEEVVALARAGSALASSTPESSARPIETAPLRTPILIAAPDWDGWLSVEWPNEFERAGELACWDNGPTHWHPQPPLPAPAEARSEQAEGGL